MNTVQLILISLTSLTCCAQKANTQTSAKTNDPAITKTMTTTSDTLNYLALGDSYTIGEAVPQAESFPCQLYGALNTSGLKVTTPTIIAATGWTTDNLINAISASGINNQKFACVTLLIGVNDQYQQLSAANYQIKFAAVLHTAINFANGDASRVFVLSIPDYGVTPFAAGMDNTISHQIDQFNAINKAISLKAGVNYVDITAISRLASTQPALVAPDGLHPSGQMYLLWVNLLAPLVEARLTK